MERTKTDIAEDADFLAMQYREIAERLTDSALSLRCTRDAGDPEEEQAAALAALVDHWQLVLNASWQGGPERPWEWMNEPGDLNPNGAPIGHALAIIEGLGAVAAALKLAERARAVAWEAVRPVSHAAITSGHAAHEVTA